MHMSKISVLCTLVALGLGTEALAQVTMTPLAGFGTNGWVAPGSMPYMTTGNNERGLAYNPTTGNLVLVSRAGGINVRVLNGATGADLGGLVVTGMAGGTFAANMAAVGDDGFIYVANLSIAAATNFKVYGWSSEAVGLTTAPLTLFDAVSGVTRTGDAFDVIGSFPTAKFCAAGSNNVSASNFVVGSLDTTNTAQAYLSVPGTTSASNDYRLAMTWIDASTLIGAQGQASAPARLTSISGATATVTASMNLGAASRRAMDYAVIGGTPVIAVIDTVSSNVTVLSMMDPLNLVALAQANNTTGTLSANGNGTGSVKWGAIIGNTATLYAMSSNQGIQAFTVTINPFANTALYGGGCDNYVLTNTGLPLLGNQTFSLDVSAPILGILPFSFVAFGSFAIPTGIDLTGIGMPGCYSYTSFDLNMFATNPVVGTTGSFVLAIPNNVSLAGATLAAQGVGLSVVTPAGLAVSNGLQFQLGF